jgi:hypothetical protein
MSHRDTSEYKVGRSPRSDIRSGDRVSRGSSSRSRHHHNRRDDSSHSSNYRDSEGSRDYRNSGDFRDSKDSKRQPSRELGLRDISSSELNKKHNYKRRGYRGREVDLSVKTPTKGPTSYPRSPERVSSKFQRREDAISVHFQDKYLPELTKSGQIKLRLINDLLDN